MHQLSCHAFTFCAESEMLDFLPLFKDEHKTIKYNTRTHHFVML